MHHRKSRHEKFAMCYFPSHTDVRSSIANILEGESSLKELREIKEGLKSSFIEGFGHKHPKLW